MELDVPLVVFDIGAPAERVRTYSRGRVIDLACASDSLRLCRELLAFFDETSGS